ncbi:MAG: hypothetical protein ABIQ41_10840, partial [Gemmatimonadales bacterium]
GASEDYILKYREDIEHDCWTTARMLLNVLNNGTKPVSVRFYHLENPSFSGYHDFIVIYEKDGPKYLCDSWCEKYTLRVQVIPSLEQFDAWLKGLKNLDITERKNQISSVFHEIPIDEEIRLDDIRISYISMTLYYDPQSVISYPTDPIKNRINLLNIDNII